MKNLEVTGTRQDETDKLVKKLELIDKIWFIVAIGVCIGGCICIIMGATDIWWIIFTLYMCLSFLELTSMMYRRGIYRGRIDVLDWSIKNVESQIKRCIDNMGEEKNAK